VISLNDGSSSQLLSVLFAFIFFVVAIAIALLFFSRGSFKDEEVTVPAGWQDSL